MIEIQRPERKKMKIVMDGEEVEDKITQLFVAVSPNGPIFAGLGQNNDVYLLNIPACRWEHVRDASNRRVFA